MVDNNHHFAFLEFAVAESFSLVARACTPLGVNYQIAAAEEFVAHLDGRVKQTAAIACEVDDELFHTHFSERVDGSNKFIVGAFGKASHLDVSRILVEHIRCIDAVERDIVASDAKFDGLRSFSALNGDINVGAFRSAKAFHNVVGFHLFAGDNRVVYSDNTVAWEQSHAFGWASGNGLDNVERVLSHIELNADARKLAGERFVELFGFFGGGVSRVRVEFVENAFNCVFHNFIFVDAIDIESRDGILSVEKFLKIFWHALSCCS